MSDATITPELLSPVDKSVSLSPESAASRSESINFGFENTDREQPSSDLKSKSTDLRRESLALESEKPVDLSPDLVSEDNDLCSESVDLKSESIELIPESLAFNYNSALSKPESALSKPESAILTPKTIHSESESMKILPQLVDSSLRSESIYLFSKPGDLDHGSTILKSLPENNSTPESANNDLDSASPKQDSLNGREHASQDLAMVDAAGSGLSSPPVLDNRGCADGVDVMVDRTNSDTSQPMVDHTESALNDSWTKHTPESKKTSLGLSIKLFVNKIKSARTYYFFSLIRRM